MVSPLFFEQGKQAGSPIVESSAIYILGFPLPSFYKYIREPLERENYEVCFLEMTMKAFITAIPLRASALRFLKF